MIQHDSYIMIHHTYLMHDYVVSRRVCQYVSMFFKCFGVARCCARSSMHNSWIILPLEIHYWEQIALFVQNEAGAVQVVRPHLKQRGHAAKRVRYTARRHGHPNNTKEMKPCNFMAWSHDPFKYGCAGKKMWTTPKHLGLGCGSKWNQ